MFPRIQLSSPRPAITVVHVANLIRLPRVYSAPRSVKTLRRFLIGKETVDRYGFYRHISYKKRGKQDNGI